MQRVKDVSALAGGVQVLDKLACNLRFKNCQVQRQRLKTFPTSLRVAEFSLGTHRLTTSKLQLGDCRLQAGYSKRSISKCSQANAPGPPKAIVVGGSPAIRGNVAHLRKYQGGTSCQALLEASQAATGKQLAVAWGAEQGLREEMEDEVAVVQDAPGGFVYAGVFDGHSGKAASHFLKEELYEECLGTLEGGKLLEKELEDEAVASIKAALTQAFAVADAKLLKWQEEEADDSDQSSGSTGTVAFVRHDRIAVAHAGDSRLVMSAGGEAHELCEDHRVSGDSPMALSEKARVNDAGGWVAGGRVCGLLAVSRAFGNAMYKTHIKDFLTAGVMKGRWTTRFVNKRKTETEWVTAKPDVYCAELPENVEFFLLGSDGLWDAVQSSEAVRIVREQMDNHGNVDKACTALIKYALEDKKTSDNISVVLIYVQ